MDASIHSTFASRYVRTSLPRFLSPFMNVLIYVIPTPPKEKKLYVLLDGLFMDACMHCRFKMGDHSIPKEAAYQIINDELMLDGNPRLNLASFVTTWMEPECDKLIMASINKNYVDMDEYPVTTELQVIHSLLHYFAFIGLLNIKDKTFIYFISNFKSKKLVY